MYKTENLQVIRHICANALTLFISYVLYLGYCWQYNIVICRYKDIFSVRLSIWKRLEVRLFDKGKTVTLSELIDTAKKRLLSWTSHHPTQSLSQGPKQAPSCYCSDEPQGNGSALYRQVFKGWVNQTGAN